eukprot:4206019-Prymnesium_polylepis.1
MWGWHVCVSHARTRGVGIPWYICIERVRNNLDSVVYRNVLRPTLFGPVSIPFRYRFNVDTCSSSRLGFGSESVSKQIQTFFCQHSAPFRALLCGDVQTRLAAMTELSIKLDTVTGFEPK